MRTLLFVLSAALSAAAPQTVEKQLVVSITAADVDNGILTEIMWDNGALLMQGVVANPDGSLSARYVDVPAKETTLMKLKEPTDASIEYWNRKSKRSSPTGIGEIVVGTDSKLPMYGISSLEQRMSDAYDMGGMQKRTTVRLGRLLMHERQDGRDPYDGQIWSWSPPELNRIAYVDGKGDLWIASADGGNPKRVLKGDFTLPAWSDDGRSIAVADRKDGGRRWEISIVTLPESMRTMR
jgi:hypothetical protein